ncbi:50S ribosomal protein L4 [Portibacter lacus]|uniref:Large ribosomal subunit protein uL4 n=1 Tax=Portibacter lacus TaxID=1099794 RepID=A0AA37WG12_9BACT|nr:50S ribosomal protein L4 [Portibacter lacus]GLR19318.1 50S ribosomal protein L4 [Portibacter lacus]
MKIDVLNIEGKATGRSVDLPDEIFGIEPNNHAVYLAVKAYHAAQRQGTHKAKEKGEITGSTRKIKRQKGTGTARAGSIKSGLFRGGGRMFGPRADRNYNLKLNKKVKQLAKASALSTKASAGSIIVVEDFTFDNPKTSNYVGVLNKLSSADKKSLLILNDYDNNLLLSSRNIKKASVVNAKDLNTFQILNAQSIILSESAIEKMQASFA